MRYLILSDLHSNLEALQAVLAATEGAYETVVCCGDLVGYGPDPDAVVNWVRENVTEVVRGNHDKACSGIMEGDDFSEVARRGVYWTRAHLSPENLQYLRNLPQGPRDVMDQFAILHGSPSDEDEYVPTALDAAESFSLLRHRVSFFGHTHLQGGFVRSRLKIREVSSKAVDKTKTRGILEIQANETYLLNPGSVGQPRDRDTRTAFAIYDTEGVVEYGRVPYDMEATMNKILEAGLPEFLAYRLTLGR
jgi:predicted phosphodiesterase